MNKLIIIFMYLCLSLCVTGYKSSAEDNYTPDDLSVTKYSEITSKYYEETSSGYKAAFYKKAEIEIEEIKDWVDSCPSGENYYQYIYSDPDSWDMFIYYSPANDGFKYSRVTFCVDDSTVKIYVTSIDSPYDVKTDYILIRVQAPIRGAWPNSSELYVNDEKIEIKKRDLLDDAKLDTETLLFQNLSEIISTMPKFMQCSENPVYLSKTSRVILATAGDLNSDGNRDLAIVVELAEINKDSPGYAEGEIGFGPRHIYVLLGNTDGSYTVVGKSEALILKHWMGGVFGDPLENVSIENGVLSINHYGGSSSRWGCTMRFSYNEGQLLLTEMAAVSHSTFTVNGEETICDFAHQMVTRYTWRYSEDPPLLLFSGGLPDKTYLFDDAAFDEIFAFSYIPFLPYLDHYQFDKYDKPLDLNISASQALDMVMAEHYNNFEKINIPWTQENRDNYSKLLFYEVPDYYYKGAEGTLKYYRLDVYENEGKVSDATHIVIFVSFDGVGMEFYDIEDK